MPLQATPSPALDWLTGARVQRVDSPIPGCLSLTLYRPADKRSLVLACSGEARGVGSVALRPKGLAASPFVRRLRTLIEGSRLQSATWLRPANASAEETNALALWLEFARGEARARLLVDFDARAPNLYIMREDETIAGALDERLRRERFPGPASAFVLGRGRGVTMVLDDETLGRAGEQLLANTEQQGLEARRTQLASATRAALKRAERKLAAIQGDIERAQTAPRLRREAEALLCHLSLVPRGASRVRVPDPSSADAEEIEIALDPARDARANAEQRFDRARKLARGVSIASQRLADTREEVAGLRAKLEKLARSDVDLEAMDGGSGESGGKAIGARAKTKSHVPYRVFVGHGGRQILVGKGAADNDTLTLTVARPHDHWLHVRGAAGSHVVVPLDRKAAIGQELLLDASHLAAHFSKSRGEPTVEIAHTERRFVRKQKGDAPGSVRVDRERVFVLRIEADRLARLLASEQS